MIRKTAIFLIALLFCVLCVRALKADRWSDWDFGDAQTLLTLNQWRHRGAVADKFLFAPQGYAPFIAALDSPELRHHAHGTSPKASIAGPRLLYTHYPPGYLLPLYAVYSCGIENPGFLRVLELLFSCAGLLFFYLAVEMFAPPVAAFCSVAFYALSPSFLGFADSLANQPIDDLLRFLFMWLTLRAAKDGSKKTLYAAWLASFALSLCSLDSVMFCFAWLVCADIIRSRTFDWKKYIVFAVAPLSAHGIAFLQNAWYLGLGGALADAHSAFAIRSLNQMSLAVKITNASAPYYFIWGKCVFAALLGGLVCLCGLVYKGEWALLKAAAALLLCGSLFMIVLPSGGSLAYQSRQLMPFFALCFGICCAYAFSDGARAFFIPALICFATLFCFSLHDLRDQFAVSQVRRDVNVSLASGLAAIKTTYDPAFFEINAFSSYWDKNYIPGFPQIHPLMEYYAGKRLILSFDLPQDIAPDIKKIMALSTAKFSAVIVAGDAERLAAALAGLRAANLLPANYKPQPFALRHREIAVIDFAGQ
jgi:hypothetical protein